MNKLTLTAALCPLLCTLACGAEAGPANPTGSASKSDEANFWWGAATSPYQVEDPGEDKFTTDWDLYFDAGKLRHARGEGVHSWTKMARDRQARGRTICVGGRWRCSFRNRMIRRRCIENEHSG